MAQQNEKRLNGLIVKNPKDGAPDFVIGAASFKVEEFIQSLRDNDKNGWVNINLKRSREGKLYAELDTWEPQGGTRTTQPRPAQPAPAESDDLPF
jgi:hypothetical protein